MYSNESTGITSINYCLLLFQCLAWQLVGLVSIFAWSAILSFIMFFTLKKMRILRVPFEYEIKGLFTASPEFNELHKSRFS